MPAVPEAKHDDFTGGLIRGWTPLYFEKFEGVTCDGVIQDLYSLEQAAPAKGRP